MATPHVAGMYAMTRLQFPTESMTDILDRLRFSTDSVGCATNTLSGGRANLYKASGTRPTLGNLSTRTFVGTGGDVTIAGLIITGTGSKRIALRAEGPNLANYGISNYLQNPTITINSGSTVIGSNDDWITLSAADRQELIDNGVAPFYNSEPGWVGTLAPGAYTVILSGVNNGTGVGLIEAFDIGGSSTARLVNLSTRASVGTGVNQTIAGFIVRGDKPRTVYLRALGPSLANFGVSGALQDTYLTLYNSAGQTLATNDNWRDMDGSSTALETRVSNRGNAPGDNRESIIVATLAPGSYTVGLSGAGGTTGVGLVDVWEF